VLVGIVVCLLGADFVTGFSAAFACVGNIGPGFGAVGPMESFAVLDPMARFILTLGMWMGRLELVAVLVLLHPHVLRSVRWGADRRQAA
ncbi:MAG: potassium transporter TrkG, partial [Planctomycetota bacterium]